MAPPHLLHPNPLLHCATPTRENSEKNHTKLSDWEPHRGWKEEGAAGQPRCEGKRGKKEGVQKKRRLFHKKVILSNEITLGYWSQLAACMLNFQERCGLAVEISCAGSIYTLNIGNYYKTRLFFWKAGWPVHHCRYPIGFGAAAIVKRK